MFLNIQTNKSFLAQHFISKSRNIHVPACPKEDHKDGCQGVKKIIFLQRGDRQNHRD